jgi:MYXO-CTERM domain-containing protein
MAPRAARLLAGVVALVLAVSLGACAAALADGDPASDVLLGESVFYPYTPPVSGSIEKALSAETAAAAHAGFPVKVALIASPIDLGVIPSLFGKPQQYADFLDQEISFQHKQPLLVVMAAGYGIQGMPAPAVAAVTTLKRPAGGTTNDLAQAALRALPKLAAAAGHPIRAASGTAAAGTATATGSGGSSTPILIIVAVGAVVIAAALLALRRRRSVARP